MSDLKIGELYLVKQYCWFLYPTKEVAGEGLDVEEGAAAGWAAGCAKFLSERYKCNVSFFGPGTYVVLLEAKENERCYKLLDSNGNIGWISCRDFSNHFDIVKAKQ